MSEQKPREFEDWWKGWNDCLRCGRDSSAKTAASNAWHFAEYEWKSHADALASQLDAALKDNAILETQYNSQIIVTGELVKKLAACEQSVKEMENYGQGNGERGGGVRIL